MILRRFLACVALAVCSYAAPRAHAQPYRLALVVDQGAIVGPGTPYLFAGKLAPGVDVGRLRLSLTVGATLASSRWDLPVGFAPSFLLLPIVSNAGVRLVAEADYLVRGDEFRATGGFVLDFDSVHIGEVAGYDWLHRSAILLTTVGFDLPRIVAFIADQPF